MIQNWIEKGANVNHRDKRGLTPIFKAISSEFTAGIQVLLETPLLDPYVSYSNFYTPFINLLKKNEFKNAVLLLKLPNFYYQLKDLWEK